MSRIRKYGLEGKAAPLILWLNKARKADPEAYSRLGTIRTLLLAVAPSGSGEILTALSTYRLNPLLKRYRLVPQVRRARRWSLAWSGENLAPGEGEALLTALALAESDYLSRVRECSHCGKWFYQKLAHNVYCSSKCQQSHFRTSEEFKRHRAEYMRENRRIHARMKKRKLRSRRRA